MTPRQLFEAGKVREAQQALTTYLRDHPADNAQRTFLFELLCFSGDYDRAEKQLAVLSQGNAQSEMGAVLYYASLHAEKTRHQVFEKQEFSRDAAGGSIADSLNGRPFSSLRDADPDLGARLEVFAAGAYLWIPFEHIASVRIDPPKKIARHVVDTGRVADWAFVQGRRVGRGAAARHLSVFVETCR